MRKTKIVCTIGPSCQSREMLEQLIGKGLDVARLNFSHGSHESHGEVIKTIRELSEKLKKPVAIMMDLCGPKIRLGEIPGGPVTVNDGALFTLVEEEIPGDSTKATITYKNLHKEIHVGARILIDDGLVELRVEEIQAGEIRCRVVTGGALSTHKGVNLPGVKLSIPALTEKDIDDLRFGLASRVDLVAISFVRSDKDLELAYRVMAEEGSSIPIISKIEKDEAVANIDKILQNSFGLMVARGDLGVELPFQEVPIIQKRLIKLCNEQSKPVITATQMMDSMIRNPMPTRAEVNDVANAILDGTDAVMLSGETASGKYPLAAVENMARIAEYTEQYLPYEEIITRVGQKNNAVEAISLATCELAEQMQAQAIIVSTSSGRTARAISKYKPRPPVIAITDTFPSARRMMLSWGVLPLVVEAAAKDTDALFETMCTAPLDTGIVKQGDLVVLTAGIPEGLRGSTNTIKLHVLGHLFTRGIGAGIMRSATGRICCVDSLEEGQKKMQKGDILLLKKVDEAIEPLLRNAAGVIAQEGDVGDSGVHILERNSLPGILGVPKACEFFREGKMVTIDALRGMIIEGQ
jgi:pyruvate kinase